MRRLWWFRLCVALAGVWLLAVLSEPAALHACAMHDGVPTAPTARDARGLPQAHAHHAGGHHAGSHHAGGPKQGGHACTCLGACCAPPAVLAARPAAIGPAAPAAVRPPLVPPVAPISYRPSAPEHARPPSVGPPSRSTA